jgi:hypothetical protein
MHISTTKTIITTFTFIINYTIIIITIIVLMLFLRQYKTVMCSLKTSKGRFAEYVAFNPFHAHLIVKTYNILISIHEVNTTDLDRLFLPFIQI